MALFAAVGSLTRPAPHFASANGAGVTLCRFDDVAGTLTACAEPLRIEDSSWIVADPARRLLHVVTDCDGGHQSALASLSVDPQTGSLTLLGTQPAGGHEGCHAALSPDGTTVFLASYGGKRPKGVDAGLAVIPVGQKGPQPALGFFSHSGNGPNTARQEAPHAHCVLPSPDGRFLFVADLGIDRLVAYELAGPSPVARPDLDVKLDPGLGPRHFVFSADGKHVYLISELEAAVTTLSYDAGSGRMQVLGRLSLVPADGATVQPSGIVLHPDGTHIFAAARQTDEIVVLAIDPATALPAIAGRYPSGGRTPRDLVVSPSGRFLLVVNQDADRITVWPIDAGRLGPEPSSVFPTGTPMTVALADFS